MLNSESKAEHLPRGTFLYEWGRGRYWIHVFADGEGGTYSKCVDTEADMVEYWDDPDEKRIC